MPEGIKNKMCNLVCMEHPNFKETLCDIEQEGGKAGAGKWLLFKAISILNHMS